MTGRKRAIAPLSAAISRRLPACLRVKVESDGSKPKSFGIAQTVTRTESCCVARGTARIIYVSYPRGTDIGLKL